MTTRWSWEIVTSTELEETTERLKVPGGWLYRTTKLATVADGASPRPVAIATALVFVPSE